MKEGAKAHVLNGQVSNVVSVEELDVISISRVGLCDETIPKPHSACTLIVALVPLIRCRPSTSNANGVIMSKAMMVSTP